MEVSEHYLSDWYFEIKIDFAQNQGDPARVFLAMGELIESFQALDRDLLSQFTVELESELLLEDIDKGSLKSKLRNLIKDIPDDALLNAEWKKILGHFLLKSKYTLLAWTEEHDKIEHRSDLESLEGELLKAAENTDIQKFPAYRPMSADRLLTNIRDISLATRKLADEDSASFQSSIGNAMISGNLAISDEAIREILTSEVRESVSEQTLQVKKPDYLGQSMWAFKYAGHAIEAKILDDDWLGRFQAQEVSVQPGDSLRASLKEEFYYGHHGEIISVHYEVLEVYKVIRPQSQQIGFDLDAN